jgi:two-component system, OmpR family, response regulator
MSVPPSILAVDDDADVRKLIFDYLVEFGLDVVCVADGKGMREHLAANAVDLVLLDLKLPGEDGMTIARELRARSGIPIIILTGSQDEVDRIMGLELGADDYLTKPFNPRELLARIRTILRRSRGHSETVALRAFRFAGWELDMRTRRLTSAQGDRVELTHAEFSLLNAFLSAPEQVLARDQLIELSRGEDDDTFDRSIDVQILRLRRKIETDPSRPELIRTERGAGYFFDAKVDIVY